LVRAVDADRSSDAEVSGHQLEACVLRAELVDRSPVQIARHEQVRQCDGEKPAQLLGVGSRITDGSGQQRGQARQTLERCPFGAGENRLDRNGRGRRAPLELSEPGVVRRLISGAVVEIDQPEQPVAGNQRQADGGLDLVAPDECAVDLRRRVKRHEPLTGDGEPHRRAVLVHAKLIGHLALVGVTQVARQLLAHVGQRVEEALLWLPCREGCVVGVGRLFVQEDRHDVRAGSVLHVGDDGAQHSRQTGVALNLGSHLSR